MKRGQAGKGAPWDLQGERGFLLKVEALIAASPQLHGVCALYCAQPMGESRAGISATKLISATNFDVSSLLGAVHEACLQPPQWCLASCLVKQ